MRRSQGTAVRVSQMRARTLHACGVWWARTSKRRNACSARPTTGGIVEVNTTTRPGRRVASWAGASTGTRRVVREATRPCRSVVVIGSSRSPASVDQ